jgi:phosphatidylserine/phosphatidylglycerophosphate/cardiolipin synthase-like enzyme
VDLRRSTRPAEAPVAGAPSASPEGAPSADATVRTRETALERWVSDHTDDAVADARPTLAPPPPAAPEVTPVRIGRATVMMGSVSASAKRAKATTDRALLTARQAYASSAALGSTFGGVVKRIGIAALGAVLSAISTLPPNDASHRTVPVRGAPLQPMTPPGTPALGAAFDNLKTIGGGPARAELLVDNLKSWNARWAMLEGATKTIDSTYFIMEKDPFGYAFLGHLLKKQRDGVEVRLLLDAMADTFGKKGFKLTGRGQDYLQELVNAGGQAGIYHPVHRRIGELHDYGALSCNHDKIITVDGRVSMTGGRNIAIDYFADPRDMPSAWRDTDTLLEGEGPAIAMRKSMDAELVGGSGVIDRIKPDQLGNLRKRDIELLGAYHMMDLWLKAPAFSEAEKAAFRANPATRMGLAEKLVADALARLPAEGITRAPSKAERKFLLEQATRLVEQLESRGSRAVYDAGRELHDTDVKILDQTSVIAGRTNDFAASLATLCDSARERIVIQNPYVVLTEDMLQALERASQRGVEIIIGTNSPLSTDSAVTQAFFLEDWPHILARVPTARIFVLTGERKLHAKVGTIDDEVSIVSTYNMDLLSGYVNSEIGAVMKSRSYTAAMKAAFVADAEDPKNGVVEYKIRRDASGKAVLQDGKPIVEFGPEDHLSAKMLEEYAGRRFTWGLIREHLPQFGPLRHPKLTDA